MVDDDGLHWVRRGANHQTSVHHPLTAHLPATFHILLRVGYSRLLRRSSGHIENTGLPYTFSSTVLYITYCVADDLQNLLELETDGGTPNKSLEDFSYVPLGSEGCIATQYLNILSM